MFGQIIGYICTGVIVGMLIFGEIILFVWVHITDKEFKEKYKDKKNNRKG